MAGRARLHGLMAENSWLLSPDWRLEREGDLGGTLKGD